MLLDYLTSEDHVADDLVLEIRRRVIDRHRILVGITALEPVLVEAALPVSFRPVPG